MLKRISLRKICVSLSALFALLLIYLIPESSPKSEIKEKLEYVNSKELASEVFLIDKNSYVALTEAIVTEKDIEKKARELIKILTIGGMDSKVPSGFSAVLPPDTEVLNLKYDNNILKINFSKDILDIEEKLEEKMIESLVYTLTSIDKVDKIIIYVEGDILTKLPKTKINLPSILDKSFGINKEFNLTSTKDILDVTIYYINQINENYYYVPVTKYLNDSRDKISIIVEELSNGINSNKNLKSFMNEKTKIVSKNIEDKIINLEISTEIQRNDMKKEIDNTVVMSVCGNYDIDKVNYNGDEKKCKKSSI